jgi:hypothetical protein
MTFATGNPVNATDPTGEGIPSPATCSVMAFLSFCQMEGGTELQDQVDRTTPVEVSQAPAEGLTESELFDAFAAEFIP